MLCVNHVSGHRNLNSEAEKGLRQTPKNKWQHLVTHSVLGSPSSCLQKTSRTEAGDLPDQ